MDEQNREDKMKRFRYVVRSADTLCKQTLKPVTLAFAGKLRSGLFLCAFGMYCITAVTSSAFAKDSNAAPPDTYAARAAFEIMPTAAACPPGQFAPIIAAVLPELIKQGFSFLQKLASDRAAEYDATAAATTADEVLINCGTLKEPNLRLRLAGLRFGYGVVSGPVVAGLSPDYQSLGFTKTPSVYMSGKFEGNSRQIRFVPATFVFNNKIAKRGDVKDLLVTLSFNFPTGSSAAMSNKTSTSASSTKNAAATDAKLAKPAKPAGTPESAAAGASDSESKATETEQAPASRGSTQSVQLPVFERISGGSQINTTSMTTGWIIVPRDSPDVKTDTHDSTMPVTLNVILKETDQGNGSKLWLEIADAISSSESSIESALLGRGQSSAATSSTSTPKK
jgi:hypothetical protein